MFANKLAGNFTGGFIYCMDLYQPGFETEQKHHEPHDGLY